MMRRWLAVVAVASAVLGGCGGVVEPEDSSTGSVQQEIRYCTATSPCPSGYECVNNGCYRSCNYGAPVTGCSSGYTCCMGAVGTDGSVLYNPYCSTYCYAI